MIITTQVTEDYYNKCNDLFDSLKANFDGKVKIGCIGFKPINCPFDWYYIPPTGLIYDNYTCLTRKKYVCLQHGEFIKYMNIVNDEPILNIDADVIIQSKLEHLYPKDNQILVSQCTFPIRTLLESSTNPRLKANTNRLKELYDLSNNEFSAAVICATPQSWDKYNLAFKDNFHNLKLLDHHAAGMFIMNCIAYSNFEVTFMDNQWHNADWFIGSPVYLKDGWLYYEDKKVQIIHTKFNGVWKY